MPKLQMDKLSKGLMRNDILVPHIDRYQALGDFPDVWNIEIRNTKESDPYFHPSGDCFTDVEQLVAEKTGKAKRRGIDFALRRVFDCGHFWHGYYQEILVAMGLVAPENVEKQVTHVHKNLIGATKERCEQVLWIGRGTLDLYDVTIPGQKETFIVDLKTMNNKEFDEGPRAETFAKWEAQVNCYMDWTGCRNAIILGVRKGGAPGIAGRPQHDLKEFKISYKPELLKDIYGRWTEAQRLIDAANAND